MNHQNMFIIKICNTYNTMMNDTYFTTIHFREGRKYLPVFVLYGEGFSVIFNYNVCKFIEKSIFDK